MSQASTYPLGTSGTALGVDAAGSVKRFTLREVLTADRTYYVATTGSDSNDGLTSGTALLTVQAALDKAATVDLAGNTLTVQIADGTYDQQLIIPALVGLKTEQQFVIHGNPTTPGNVVLTTSAQYAIAATVAAGVRCTLDSVGVAATNGGYGIAVTGGFLYHRNLNFGNCGSAHLVVNRNGVALSRYETATISSGAGNSIYAAAGGFILFENCSIAINGTPNFWDCFAFADAGGQINAQNTTYSGAATGTRYKANAGIISTNGGGASFFPGSSAGSTSNNGVYL